MSGKTKQILLSLLGAAGAVFLDQWTKGLAVTHLKGQAPFVIWEGVFELLYSENRGAAFGMMQGKQGLFFLITLVVLAAAAFVMIKMPLEKRYLPLNICTVMVAAGAVGNMIDRVTQGYVVDFLYFKLINFPIFNVADIYVTVSAALLMVLFLFYYKEEDMDVFAFKKKGVSA